MTYLSHTASFHPNERIAPSNHGIKHLANEAFIVLREALKRTGKVGLGQLALRGHEYVVSLKPSGRGLVMETLRYADEMEKAQGYFAKVPDDKPDDELLELAEALIDKKSGAFHPKDYHDRYVDALHELIERKRNAKGRRVIEDDGHDDKAKSDNVVDLMAALRRSMEGKGGKSTGGKSAGGKTTSGKPAAKGGTKAKAPAKAMKPAAKKRA